MSNKIASAYVEIGADTTKLKSGLLTAKSGVTDLKRDMMSAIGVNFSLAGAFTAVGAGLKYMIDEASTAENANTKLNAVLRATGGAAGLTAEELNLMSAQMSRLTGIEDDTITNAQAILLTFRQIGSDVFPEAMTVAADMSTVMGGDLNGAVLQLGKALNDPITGLTTLKRVGVSFTESQKDTIRSLQESGDLMGAQAIILEELQAEFGGAAVAAGDTFAGSLEKLRTAIGNVAERPGTKLINFLTQAADAATILINRQDVLTEVFVAHSGEVLDTATTYQEYRDEIVRSAIATDQINQAQLDLMESTENEAAINEWLTQQTRLLSESQWEWANSSRAAALDEYAAARSADDASVALGITEQAARDAATSLDGVVVAIGHLTQAKLGQQAIDALDEALQAGIITQEDYEEGLYTIGTTMLGLSAAEITTSIGAKQLSQQLITGNMNVTQYSRAMRSLSSTAEETNRIQEGLTRSLDEYNEASHEAPALAYAAARSIETYRNQLKMQDETITNTLPGLGRMYESLTSVEDSAGGAAMAMGSARGAIDGLYGKTVDVTVNFTARGDTWIAGYAGYNQASYSSAQTNASTTGVSSLEQYVLENFAGGVDDYVVPAGYPNDSALIGVSSGEHVSVTPNGGSSGGNTYVFNVSGYDPQEIADKIAHKLHLQGVRV